MLTSLSKIVREHNGEGLEDGRRAVEQSLKIIKSKDIRNSNRRKRIN